MIEYEYAGLQDYRRVFAFEDKPLGECTMKVKGVPKTILDLVGLEGWDVAQWRADAYRTRTATACTDFKLHKEFCWKDIPGTVDAADRQLVADAIMEAAPKIAKGDISGSGAFSPYFAAILKFSNPDGGRFYLVKIGYGMSSNDAQYSVVSANNESGFAAIAMHRFVDECAPRFLGFAPTAHGRGISANAGDVEKHLREPGIIGKFEAKIRELERMIADMAEQIKAKSGELGKAIQKGAELGAYNQSLERTVEDKERRIIALVSDVEGLNTVVKSRGDDIRDLEERFGKDVADLKQRLHATGSAIDSAKSSLDNSGFGSRTKSIAVAKTHLITAKGHCTGAAPAAMPQRT